MTLYNSQGGDLAVSVGGVYYFTDAVSAESFDRKRQRNEQATGNRNNTVDFHDGDSDVKAHIKKNLCDTDTALLPIVGLGATIGAPTSTTIIYADPNRTVTCTNALCNDVTIAGEKGKAWDLDANFLCTSVPARTAGYGLVRPTFAAVGNYLYWRDLLTFFSAAASSTNCQKFMIKINHNLDPFYGVRADGYTIPTVYTPGTIEVTGSFTMQMLGFADYDLFLAACDTAADLGITAKCFCNGATVVLTMTSKSSIYESVKPVRALKKTSLEELSFVSKALAGANQAVVTMA